MVKHDPFVRPGATLTELRTGLGTKTTKPACQLRRIVRGIRNDAYYHYDIISGHSRRAYEALGATLTLRTCERLTFCRGFDVTDKRNSATP